MTHLELEIKQLKVAVLDMMKLVRSQVANTREAWMNMDTDLAEEIIHKEKRVNALELSIDRDCENIFALFNPVAIDLRFVVSALKINSDLERIGDYADGIADYVVEFQQPVKKEIMDAINLDNMFEIAISMVDMMVEAFEVEDATLARKVFKKDSMLNEINKEAPDILKKYIMKSPDHTTECLYLFSVVRKLERVGDHVKNVSEDLIFYLEAEVLKHLKSQSRKGSKSGK